MKTYLNNPLFSDNLYYIVDPISKQIIAKVDKKLGEYYYVPKLESQSTKGIQPNLYFDNE